ncbi:MAG: molecular chaperone TorD family protein [Caldimicrobium sp.]|nr:molecular chaperone TorD family protein [Caldimicrobium sp.]MCX7613451.1 molecular chaperone TorD family protein [Caldimicrobium sp.]MDW8182977.1 molecular chaperone TorD family protein [Caldimicrobium sp.]
MEERSKGLLRSKLYRYFSAFFCLPEKEVHGDPVVWQDFLECAMEYDYTLYEQVKTLKSAFEEFDEAELQIEYTRLFLGASLEVPAPPYGSVYLEDRQIMGKTTLEVKKFFQREGLQVDDNWPHPPDHIVSELEFMGYLTLREGEDQFAGNEDIINQFFTKQKFFFNRYLYNFCLRFIQSIKTNTENAFFLALANSFESFIKCEAKVLYDPNYFITPLSVISN